MNRYVRLAILVAVLPLVLGNGGCQTTGGSNDAFGIKQNATTVAVSVAVIGLVGYLVVADRHNITGCVQEVDGAKVLSQGPRRYQYTLEGVPVKAGERVHLVGTKHKEKDGTRTFDVTRVAQDYGACST